MALQSVGHSWATFTFTLVLIIIIILLTLFHVGFLLPTIPTTCTCTHTHTHTHTYFGAFCGTSCFKESTSHHVISPVSTLYTLLIAKDCLKNHIYHSIYTKQNLQFFKYCLIAAKHLSFKLPLLSQRCIFTIGSFELGLIWESLLSILHSQSHSLSQILHGWVSCKNGRVKDINNETETNVTELDSHFSGDS